MVSGRGQRIYSPNASVLCKSRAKDDALKTNVLKENDIPVETVRICCSPFARTVHTARVVASVLNLILYLWSCLGCSVRDLLAWFFLSCSRQHVEIWVLDEKNPFKRPEGGECVHDVARLTKAISDVEMEHNGCTILVVSHGDPLQILQTIVKEPSGNKD
ncbi:hypothetical protein MLD38_032267 [Melastoma candidum]|uniref:Uncharacterized protein n=1 Tax=Melastoma candidum TaxID=119954 RepID=A0ACB9M4D8_9MYRT|nr:hypothetical protein MLD38_032267 [Melastoma candidum]